MANDARALRNAAFRALMASGVTAKQIERLRLGDLAVTNGQATLRVAETDTAIRLSPVASVAVRRYLEAIPFAISAPQALTIATIRRAVRSSRRPC